MLAPVWPLNTALDPEFAGSGQLVQPPLITRALLVSSYVPAPTAEVNCPTPTGALVRPATVTVTSTAPLPAGLVALQLLVDAHETAVAAAAPKRTIVAPADVLNPVPLTVTTVPPAAEPVFGDSPLTVGGSTAQLG